MLYLGLINLSKCILQIREERKQELEAQLAAVNARVKIATEDNNANIELSTSEVEAENDNEGISDSGEPEHGDESFGTDEYIDEGKFTRVTVEPVEISKHGAMPLEMHTAQDKLATLHNTPEAKGSSQGLVDYGSMTKAKLQRSKPHWKKKFRYESAGERKKARAKIRLKKSSHSMKRRSG